MLAVLRGIEQKEFKEALIKLLDNIDVSYLKNFSNKNNPINLLLSFLPGQAKDLLGSLNAYKNDDKNAYKNILDGAKFFIRNFDFNTFINVLNQKKSEKTFSYEEEEFNAILNSSNTVKRNLLLTSLDFDDIIFAFLKGNFNTPGSNKRVKEELIKMFNLSSKGSSIEIAEK
ncbi:hypothetical protein NWP96_06820 [Mycoplasmopsis cynos]|nr:hypothetical protein [Mycoplasmopsis cynos]